MNVTWLLVPPGFDTVMLTRPAELTGGMTAVIWVSELIVKLDAPVIAKAVLKYWPVSVTVVLWDMDPVDRLIELMIGGGTGSWIRCAPLASAVAACAKTDERFAEAPAVFWTQKK